jgi:hypothetical protein
MVEEKKDKKSERYLRHTLERYYMPIKMLTSNYYSSLHIVNPLAKDIIKWIEKNINKADTTAYRPDMQIWNETWIDYLLALLYEYDSKNKHDQMLYMAYITFNGLLSHYIHCVIFEGNWIPSVKEYICDIDEWKDLITKLQKMQCIYDDKIRVDFYIDYIPDLVGIKILEKGKQEDFFAQFKQNRYTDVTRIVHTYYLENPAQEIEKWIKTVDVEPSGLGAQAAKEEFEGLIKANEQRDSSSV